MRIVQFILLPVLPSPDFSQAARNAIAKGSAMNFSFPIPPTQEEIMRACQCMQPVMGDYYPVAAWCDKATFVAGGWQACVAGL